MTKCCAAWTWCAIILPPVSAERDRLLELIPSRRRELEEIAAGNAEAARVAQERQKAEEAERQIRQAQEAQEREAALETSAEIDKVHNGVDSESAAPVLQLAKGTVQQKKVPTHNA
jgi:hypothetical protein